MANWVRVNQHPLWVRPLSGQQMLDLNSETMIYSKDHFRQGSRDQKPRDQFETNWTLNWTFLQIKQNHFFLGYNEFV
jgi:hypothetical protein